jgi:TolA-binding protein
VRRLSSISIALLALLLMVLGPGPSLAQQPGEPPAEVDEGDEVEGDEVEGDEVEGDEVEGDEVEGDDEEAVDLNAESDGEIPKCERSPAAQDEAAPKDGEKPAEKKPATPEELARADLETAVDRYTDAARDFQAEMHALIKRDVDGQKAFIERTYGKKIDDIESSERLRRLEAIKRFQRFIQEYPNDPQYTPDAMFRLAELYFEYSAVRFADALDQFDKDNNLYERGKIPSEPQQPDREFSDCVRLYKTLIGRFGETYRYADAVYYLLGYVHGEGADDEESLKAWYRLVKRFPKSEYAPETWLRIGEVHFDFGEFDKAATAYKAVAAFPNSSYYDKSLYKLGWTYFQLYDYDTAIKTFQKLISWYDRTGKSGDVVASALREEAIDYLAMSLAEDDWDNDGLPDEDSGVQRGLRYLSDGKPYEKEVVTRYAKALYDLSDKKKWGEAIEVYRHLVQQSPLSAEAADNQAEIIKLYDEMREIDEASAERKLLAENYGPGSDWWRANSDNPAALRRMRKAVEQAMSQRALYHHQRAQELKLQAKLEDKSELLVAASAEYGKASRAYEDYLDTYPHEPIVYDMTFYLAETLWYSGQFLRAAPIYHRVATDLKKSEYREPAAWSSVKAREKVLERLAQSGEVPAKLVPGSEWGPTEDEEEEGEEGAEQEPAGALPIIEEEIPEAVLAWITAADHYLDAGFDRKGDAEALSILAYQVAETYLRTNRLDEARERFKKVISCHPEAEVSAYAIANIINSYRAQNDFPNLEKWADLAEQLELGDPELQAAIRKEIKLFKLGAQFKHAEALYQGEKWLEAAREFERLARANMDASFADKAFFNAAVGYKNARYYDSAASLFEILVTDDRFRESVFAEESLFELAEANKQFFSFEKATSAFQALFKRYPAGKNRRYALFQSARLQEAAGDYRVSAKTYEQYTQMFPERAESAGLIFLIGELYEKIDDVREQERIWKLFTKTQSANPKMNQFYIRALSKLSHINRAKRRGLRAAEKIEKQILREYVSRGLNPGTPASKAAAEARFHQVEKTFEKYKRLRMNSPNQKKATKTIARKQAMLKQLEEEYGSILAYKSLDWTIAVALRLADIYKEFAETLYKAPEPKGLTDDEYDIFVTMIEDLGLKFENVAIKRYATAVQQSRRLKVTNDWAMRALQAINKYKPTEYPLFKEEKQRTVSDPLYTIDTRRPEGR